MTQVEKLPLLVIGHVLTADVIWIWISKDIGGRNAKTPALIAGAPFPFPFRAFVPLPFFAPQAINKFGIITGDSLSPLHPAFCLFPSAGRKES